MFGSYKGQMDIMEGLRKLRMSILTGNSITLDKYLYFGVLFHFYQIELETWHILSNWYLLSNSFPTQVSVHRKSTKSAVRLIM